MTRHAIREFVTNLQVHLKHLLEYLVQVQKERVLQEHYAQINLRQEFSMFKETLLKTRGSGMTTPLKVEEFFLQTFEKCQDSFQTTLDTVIKSLEEKIHEVKSINLKGGS